MSEFGGYSPRDDFDVGAEAAVTTAAPPLPAPAPAPLATNISQGRFMTVHWYDYLNPLYWFAHDQWVSEHMDAASREKYLAARPGALKK